jgi:hypothetical protein
MAIICGLPLDKVQTTLLREVLIMEIHGRDKPQKILLVFLDGKWHMEMEYGLPLDKVQTQLREVLTELHGWVLPQLVALEVADMDWRMEMVYGLPEVWAQIWQQVVTMVSHGPVELKMAVLVVFVWI